MAAERLWGEDWATASVHQQLQRWIYHQTHHHHPSSGHLRPQASASQSRGPDPPSSSESSLSERAQFEAQLVQRSSHQDHHEEASSVSPVPFGEQEGAPDPAGSLCGLAGPPVRGGQSLQSSRAPPDTPTRHVQTADELGTGLREVAGAFPALFQALFP